MSIRFILSIRFSMVSRLVRMIGVLSYSKQLKKKFNNITILLKAERAASLSYAWASFQVTVGCRDKWHSEDPFSTNLVQVSDFSYGEITHVLKNFLASKERTAHYGTCQWMS
jgi:hypothetical protein